MKKIALVGNPNCGKSTFFNAASKSDEHVGNWHGVTVDAKEKTFKFRDEQITLVDLPGTYSLSPYSYEETITKNYLLSHKDIKVINIIDGNNLARNLLLTLELLELGIDFVVFINMANDLKKSGTKIDTKNIEKLLGVKVFLIDAQNKKDAQNILEYICVNEIKYQQPTFDYIKKISKIFDDVKCDFLPRNLTIFEKVKILEQDEDVINKFKISNIEQEKLTKLLEQNKTLDYCFDLRFNFINNVVKTSVNFVQKNSKKNVYGFSKFDRLALNKFLAIPIFVLIMCGVFWLTFGAVGSSMAEFFSGFTEQFLLSPISTFVSQNISNLFVSKFISEAFCGSIISLVSFLPQVVLIYFCLFLLEESGYMSRVAFVFEDFFKLVGLSGKSVFVLLMSFGCSTTATLVSRNLEDKSSKIKTAMMAPYISCSAKLPLYAVVCGAFFPRHKFLIVSLLYLLGIVISLLVCFFLNKRILKSGKTSFLMEMPKYRFPNLKKLVKNLLTNTKQFMLRAGTVLICFSCIVWIVQNCNFKFQYVQNGSILETLSSVVAPLFVPLGFGTTGAVSAIFCGVVAKEIIVSTIGIINGLDGTSKLSDISASLLIGSSAICLTKSSAISFLVFALLYFPCASTISVMKKEIGGKWTFFACSIQLLMGYLICFVIYRIARFFEVFGVISGLLSLFVFLFVCLALFFVIKIIKKKQFCKFCPKNKFCKKM